MENKKKFYKEQAEQFKGYFQKFPDRDLLSLFYEWAESKDIEGKDRHYIWKIARHFRSCQIKEIEKGSEEAVRIGELINVIFGADLEKLKKISEGKEKK